MSPQLDDLLAACLQLPEADRLLIAEHLLESVPQDLPGPSLHDPGFVDELEHRSQDGQPGVPLGDLWKRS